MSQPPIEYHAFENGLSVLLREARVAPVVEVEIWADVGAADEREGEAGLAHFHEHMLFKGTQRRGLGQIAAEIEGAGGRINAYTSFDVTVYHATLPAAELSLGLDVLADAVTASIFDPEEIAREVEVVLEEIRGAEDSPGSVLGNAVFAAAWDRHPYRAPILGSRASVASFDQARVRAFFERWYTPEHLCVVIAGDFEPVAALEEVRRWFAARRPGGARRARPAEPERRGLRCALLARPFERVNLELAFPAVSLAHPDAPPLDLLAYVLGTGDSSRLVRRIRERDGLADRIDAGCFTPLDPGLFSVSFETDAERAAPALEASVRELERVRAEPVAADELEKARANFLASEDFERESVSGLAQKLGSFHHLGGGYAREASYLAALKSATPDDLLRVARRYLDPENLTVGAVLPLASQGALDEAGVRRAVGAGAARVARAFSAPAPRAAARDIASYELPGGGALYVVPRREVPVVAARAAFLGGLLAETPQTSGLGAFLSSMWLRGTRGRSAADFARATESLAADIEGFAGRSSLGLTLEAPSARFAEAFDLFAEVLLEPAFDEAEVEHERRETLAAIERREDQLAQRAFLLFAETIFRTHPYRMPVLGRRETVEGFDRLALAAHHDRLVRASNLSLAVAGDVDPDAVARLVSARLADLDARGFEPPATPDEPPSREVRTALLRKDREQAHVVIGFRGLSVRDPDRYPLEVISQLLGGQGGRLFVELRDRRGLAYAVSSINVEGLAPGWFCVYMGTAPEKLEAAQAGLLDQLRGLLDAPPDDSELDRARRCLIGNFAIDEQRNAVHAAHVSLDALYGLGPAASRGYADAIRAVGKEDVLRVARRVIDLGAYTEAVVRP